MEANLEKELEEEEERCQTIEQMCNEEEKELRELDILGEELEVKFKGVLMTQLICYNYFLTIPDLDLDPSLCLFIIPYNPYCLSFRFIMFS